MWFVAAAGLYSGIQGDLCEELWAERGESSSSCRTDGRVVG